MSERTADSSRSLDARTLERVGVYALLYGCALLFVLPYLWMFSLSLKPSEWIFTQEVHWIPPEVTLEWYVRVLTESLLIEWVISTFVIASLTTLIVLLVDSLVAFSLTRLEWPGQRLVLGVILASFMVPAYINIIPLYDVVSGLGLINSYWGVILPFAAGPIGVFLLVQFFRDLPDDLEEAARLDGFSTLRIYAVIILPLSKSIMAALGLFTFVWSWNQFLWPLIVLQSEELYTLPVGLVTLSDAFAYEPGLIMAATVLASLPLFVLFLLLQKHLINAIRVQGAVKE